MLDEGTSSTECRVHYNILESDKEGRPPNHPMFNTASKSPLFLIALNENKVREIIMWYLETCHPKYDSSTAYVFCAYNFTYRNSHFLLFISFLLKAYNKSHQRYWPTTAVGEEAFCKSNLPYAPMLMKQNKRQSTKREFYGKHHTEPLYFLLNTSNVFIPSWLKETLGKNHFKMQILLTLTLSISLMLCILSCYRHVFTLATTWLWQHWQAKRGMRAVKLKCTKEQS